MEFVWLSVSRNDLKIELKQCRDEGKDVPPALQAEFDALDVDEVWSDPALRPKAGALLDRTALLPVRGDFRYVEPSKLAEILAVRPAAVKIPAMKLGRNALLDKAHGAWTGRCAGCLLGKGVEGRHSSQIENYLKSQGRWPLTTWFSNQADEAVRAENKFPPPDNPFYAENITCMVEDDDTNYTTVGLAVMKRKGAAFTPEDIAEFWLRQIPILHCCTAELVAYRNTVNLLPVPDGQGNFAGPYSTATYRNPYREWIGAQIRGDFFGYACPGDPQRAAELAYRDAALSHVKNGIYGEMWVAAMLAAAYVCDDVEQVIRAGMAQIPANCRLHEDLAQVLAWRAAGLSYEQAIGTFRQRWNEHNGHHWVHTNSNAQLVAVALLWGEMDLGTTLCRAVMPGFDTDCNGATAGSVLGLILGRKALPAEWADPIRDTLVTGVHGYHEVSLSDMAARTIEVIEAIS